MSTNQPPIVNAVHYHESAGVVQVYPVLATQVLGPQDGEDLGTGTGETLAPTGGINDSNQQIGSFVIDFLDDRYAAYMHSTNLDAVQRGGIYRRGNGGTNGDGWGRDYAWLASPSHMTNFVVHHPNGIPTLAIVYSTNSPSQVRYVYTTDGINWNENIMIPSSGNISLGNLITWNSYIVFTHGTSLSAEITMYDPATTLTQSFDLPFSVGVQGKYATCFVFNNTIYAHYPITNNSSLARFDGSLFTQIHTFSGSATGGQHVIFADPYSSNTDGSKDLILICNYTNLGSKCFVINNPETTVDVVEITSTIFGDGTTYDGGFGIGANQYADGGLNEVNGRTWQVISDTRDFENPKVFLWTQDGANTLDCWEWRGQTNELEAVNSLTGIPWFFALPNNPISHSLHSPNAARLEIGGAPVEDVGGTRFYFRLYGTSAVVTATFYGNDTQDRPETVVPIIGGSLVVESGSPSTTPSISGNTITNLTPDDGATLYSVTLDVDASGIDITEGEYGLIVGDVQQEYKV